MTKMPMAYSRRDGSPTLTKGLVVLCLWLAVLAHCIHAKLTIPARGPHRKHPAGPPKRPPPFKWPRLPRVPQLSYRPGGKPAPGRVQRLTLPKDKLSIRVEVKHHNKLVLVAEKDTVVGAFSPYPRGKDARGKALPDAFSVKPSEEFSTFYVYTTDPTLHNKLSFSRPGVFALLRAVGVEVSGWSGAFEPIPFIKPTQGSHHQHTVMRKAASVTLKYSCSKQSSAKVLLHLNVVATPASTPIALPPPRTTKRRTSPKRPPGKRPPPKRTARRSPPRKRTANIPPKRRKSAPKRPAPRKQPSPRSRAAGRGKPHAKARPARQPRRGVVKSRRNPRRGAPKVQARNGKPGASKKFSTPGRNIATARKLLSTKPMRVAAPRSAPRRPPPFRRFNKLISISFSKECNTLARHDVTPIPGFMVTTSNKPVPKAVDYVVRNGIVVNNYGVFDKSLKHAKTIPKNMIAVSFFVRSTTRSSPPIIVQRPIASVSNPTVLRTSMGGELEKARTILAPNKVRLFTVNFFCLKKGETGVTVTLRTNKGQTAFAFKKICPGLRDTEGSGVRGLSVGTGQDPKHRHDVVRNGFAQKEFRAPVSARRQQRDVKRHNKFEVGADQERMEFFFSSPKSQRFTAPSVVAESVNKNLPVAFPSLSGDLLQQQSMAGKSKPIGLTLNFGCIRAGEADVRVKLPLLPAGAVEFSVLKKCKTLPKNAKRPDGAVTHVVPGFNIGLDAPGKARDSVVKNGVPTEPFHWANDVQDLHWAAPPDLFTTFVLSFEDLAAKKFRAFREAQNKKRLSKAKLDAEPDSYNTTFIVIEQPVVFSQFPLVRPELSGQASRFKQVYRDGHSHSLTVTYNCERRGSTLITLAIPMKVYTRTLSVKQSKVLSTLVRHEQVVISLNKECARVRRRTVAGSGGVGMLGFCIGTKPLGCDVVKDGFPRTAYFNQRTKKHPKWDKIIVPSRKRNLPLYLSYNHSAGDDIVPFQAPSVLVHDDTYSVELSGEAADGGTLANVRPSKGKKPSGKPHANAKKMIELDLNFKCQYRGLAAATLSIPLLPHGVIHFSVPKQCSGARAPGGIRMSGLKVGLSPGGGQVVDNGITKRDFTTYSKGSRGDRWLVDEDEDVTTFFVVRKSPYPNLMKNIRKFLGKKFKQNVSPSPLQANEPVVFAHRPIVNPVLTHSLAHSLVKAVNASTGNATYEDGDTLLIGDTVDTINVSYHCTWDGATPISVTIPLLPRGQLSFTWTKVCRCDGCSGLTPDGGYNRDPDTEVAGGEPAAVNIDSTSPHSTDASTMDSASASSGSGEETRASASTVVLHETDEAPAKRPAPKDIDELEAKSDREFQHLDERHWNAGVEAQPANDNLPSNVGYVNVGTSETQSNDVVFLGRPCPMYALPYGTGSDEDADSPVVVHQETKSNTFYVSVPDGVQEIGMPFVKAQPNPRTSLPVCEPSLDGDIGFGALVDSSKPHKKLELVYNCVGPGVTPVLVSIPLVPNGFVSFRVMKVCGGFHAHYGSTWTVSRVLGLCVVLSLFALLCIYKYCSRRSQKGSSAEMALLGGSR